MFTKTLGVEDSYEAYDFYNKDKNFDSEKSRVNEKFAKSAQLGINVQKQSLSLDFIKGELLKKCVCILLVDAGKLKNAKNLDDDDSVFIDELDQNFLDRCLFKKSSIIQIKNRIWITFLIKPDICIPTMCSYQVSDRVSLKICRSKY